MEHKDSLKPGGAPEAQSASFARLGRGNNSGSPPVVPIPTKFDMVLCPRCHARQKPGRKSCFACLAPFAAEGEAANHAVPQV
ncbi:MAG: hypothetical protein ACOX7P_03400 [Oscillospiraceae bacterium]|jgi:hypothetical protein